MSGHTVWRDAAENIEANRSRMKVESGARIAFQGERGAFSEEAAMKLLGEEIVLVPRPHFRGDVRFD